MCRLGVHGVLGGDSAAANQIRLYLFKLRRSSTCCDCPAMTSFRVRLTGAPLSVARWKCDPPTLRRRAQETTNQSLVLWNCNLMGHHGQVKMPGNVPVLRKNKSIERRELCARNRTEMRDLASSYKTRRGSDPVI